MTQQAATLPDERVWIAFNRGKRIAHGTPRAVATALRAYNDRHPQAQPLLFDARTGANVEIDLRGSLAQVLRSLPPAPPRQNEADPPAPSARAPGRPRLGVVAREVTLLPRHWQWLATQPGGASVTLRRLVEQARRAGSEADRQRAAREAAYRFMHALAGDYPGFEEATRALFAGDLARLEQQMDKWPRDVRDHALALARAADAS